MSESPTVVITGANRGIGLEFCRQYAAKGWQVFAACRDPENADDLLSLTEIYSQIEVLYLDIVDEDNVKEFAEDLQGVAIDVLINNAGMYGENAPLLPVNIENWQEVMRLNCMAPMQLSQMLTENIAASEQKKIITISSDMGSISENTGGGAYLYRSSKAAINAAMYSLSLDLKDQGITVALLHPGHVQTDMGGPNAKISPQESISGLIKVIDELDIEQSGAYRNWLGEVMGW